MLTAVDLIFVVVYVRDVYFVQRGAGNGLVLMACEKWKLKDCPLKMASSPCWAYNFADDILVFCTTLDMACLLLDELVASLAEVGLTLNVKKILTTQAQPPKSSRVEPACPKAAPLGRRETTKPKIISTLTTSASKI